MDMSMRNGVLEHVEEGMNVYNRNGDKIGTVEDIQFGQEDLSQPGPETSTVSDATYDYDRNSLVDMFAEAIAPAPDVPDELKARMMRYGFIRIDAGLLKSDRVAMTDQIDRVTEDGVHLKTADHDELVKL